MAQEQADELLSKRYDTGNWLNHWHHVPSGNSHSKGVHGRKPCKLLCILRPVFFSLCTPLTPSITLSHVDWEYYSHNFTFPSPLCYSCSAFAYSHWWCTALWHSGPLSPQLIFLHVHISLMKSSFPISLYNYSFCLKNHSRIPISLCPFLVYQLQLSHTSFPQLRYVTASISFVSLNVGTLTRRVLFHFFLAHISVIHHPPQVLTHLSAMRMFSP